MKHPNIRTLLLTTPVLTNKNTLVTTVEREPGYFLGAGGYDPSPQRRNLRPLAHHASALAKLPSHLLVYHSLENGCIHTVDDDINGQATVAAGSHQLAFVVWRTLKSCEGKKES